MGSVDWRRTRRKGHFSVDQIIGVLREQEVGAATEEVCNPLRRALQRATIWRE
jgi:hypothetical protein